METMVLVGAEQLTNAMYSLREVASTIERASGAHEYALRQHQQFLDDWLMRLQQALNDAQKAQVAQQEGRG